MWKHRFIMTIFFKKKSFFIKKGNPPNGGPI
ncbi:hypothetical protein J801_4258, partial [Acinetobacter baumannii 45002_8]